MEMVLKQKENEKTSKNMWMKKQGYMEINT